MYWNSSSFQLPHSDKPTHSNTFLVHFFFSRPDSNLHSIQFHSSERKLLSHRKKCLVSLLPLSLSVWWVYSFCEQVAWRTALWYDDWTHVKSGRNFSFHHDKIEFECDWMNVIVPYRISARLIVRSQHKQKKGGATISLKRSDWYNGSTISGNKSLLSVQLPALTFNKVGKPARK